MREMVFQLSADCGRDLAVEVVIEFGHEICAIDQTVTPFVPLHSGWLKCGASASRNIRRPRKRRALIAGIPSPRTAAASSRESCCRSNRISTTRYFAGKLMTPFSISERHLAPEDKRSRSSVHV